MAKIHKFIFYKGFIMIDNKKVSAVIVGGGKSSRMGFNKLMYKINNIPVIMHSIAAFEDNELTDEIVVVCGDNINEIEQMVKVFKKPISVVKGGNYRFESVVNGVNAASGYFVAIHDGARPYVSNEVINNALLQAAKTGASAPCVNVKDTIKLADENKNVVNTPNRELLFAIQTPQCFVKQTYLQIAQKNKNLNITDDCALYENANETVVLTLGDYANIKITTKEDLPLISNNKKEGFNMRIGHGYDVHRLVENRKLILGGVHIPFELGLLGHSDADVLLHSICDSILGACALRDIGYHFPDSANTYKDVSSINLLKKIVQLISEHNYTIINIDSTVICQAPKLAPYIPQMIENIANATGIDRNCVSVKATTEEGLGFTGAKQGISSHCVCLLQKNQ